MSFHKKDMWGRIVLPSRAYKSFKQLRSDGLFHPQYRWRMCCAKYRKKIRKMQIAKESRRRNRR